MNWRGLDGVESYSELVKTLGEILEAPEPVIAERLFNEAMISGSNVAQSAQTFGVTPHVFNEQMQRFYENTDAFVFELIRSHITRYCGVVDERVVRAVTTRFPARPATRALMLGDGIGSDALRFARLGYTTAYFEFPGPSARFARWRFERTGLAGAIQVFKHPSEIPADTFDVLVCREVLEHVPQPAAIIADMRRYLRDNGLAVITESFARVEPGFTTHLAENKQYEGRTELLYAQAGFRLEEVFPQERPFVFRKQPQPSVSTLRPALRRLAGRARGKVRWFLEAVASHL